MRSDKLHMRGLQGGELSNLVQQTIINTYTRKPGLRITETGREHERAILDTASSKRWVLSHRRSKLAVGEAIETDRTQSYQI